MILPVRNFPLKLAIRKDSVQVKNKMMANLVAEDAVYYIDEDGTRQPLKAVVEKNGGCKWHLLCRLQPPTVYDGIE